MIDVPLPLLAPEAPVWLDVQVNVVPDNVEVRLSAVDSPEQTALSPETLAIGVGLTVMQVCDVQAAAKE